MTLASVPAAAVEAAAPLLSVRDLSVAFGPKSVVHDVSFDIAPGETLALVGESGCGKSITASAVMQLLPSGARLSGGSVLFKGEDLAAKPPRELRAIQGKRISLILQEPMTSLNPLLRVGEQIAEILRRHDGLDRKQARARAIELLDLVGIPDPHKRARQYPHNFSGGMRQRVMIAIAVACRPELLIADEPTTALDVSVQSQIMALIDDLRRDLGMAVLLITHDLGVVAQYADRVAVMYAGRMVERADIRPFFRHPMHPYAQGLKASIVGHDGSAHYSHEELSAIPGTIASAEGLKGCPFRPRCARGSSECDLSPPPLAPREGRDVACYHPVLP